MKLNDILKEGLIKLPKTVHGDMIKFFVRMYLAYYQDAIEEDLVGKAYYEAKKLADEVATEYDAHVGESDMKRLGKQIKEKFLLTADDIPYADKLSKIYPNFVEELGLPIKITLAMDFRQQPGKADEIADFDPNDNTVRVVMSAAKLSTLDDDDARRKAITKYLDQAIGLISHELTHAVQHIVLSRFHESQISNAFDAAKSKGINRHTDAYFNSQIEFDPWIKGEMAIFKSIEREMKKLSKDYDRKLSMEFFVASKGEKKTDFIDPDNYEKLMFTAPSAFFLSLKKHDPEKWKKAVKLFYQGV